MQPQEKHAFGRPFLLCRLAWKMCADRHPKNHYPTTLLKELRMTDLVTVSRDGAIVTVMRNRLKSSTP